LSGFFISVACVLWEVKFNIENWLLTILK